MSHADAAAHARFHAQRLGEPLPLPFLTVAGGAFAIEEDCDACGLHGRVIETPGGWLCSSCAGPETTE